MFANNNVEYYDTFFGGGGGRKMNTLKLDFLNSYFIFKKFNNTITL